MDLELSPRRRNLILVNACVITFMATVDGSIVNIALPTLAASLGVGIQAIQWVVTSYLLVVSALLLPWGRLSDLYGRKRFFAAGLGIFTLGSLLCGLSTSLAFLVASRVVQGLGAAMAMALVQGIVTSTFPPAERGRALGFIGSVVAVGSLVGPSLGGLLVHAYGWRSIFFINVPVGCLGVVATILNLPETRGRRAEEGFDAAGAILLAGAITAFFGGLLSLQEGSLPEPAALALLGAGLVLFLAFLRAERRPSPLVDGSLFRSRIFTMGVVDSYLSYMGMFCYIFFMPFYLQNVRGLGVLGAGAMMSLYPAVTAFASPLSGALSDRITYRPLTIGGLGLTATGLALLSLLGPSTPLVLIGLVVVLMGLGGAAFQSPNNSSVMGAVPRDRLGIAGSLNAFFRNLGMVSGTTLAVSLFTLVTKTRFTAGGGAGMDAGLFLRGFRTVALVAAGLVLCGVLGEVFGKRGKAQA